MGAPTTADQIGLGITIHLANATGPGVAAITSSMAGLQSTVAGNVAQIEISLAGLGRAAAEAGGTGGWQMLALGVDSAMSVLGRARDVVAGVIGRITEMGSKAEDTRIALGAMLQAGGAQGIGEGAEGFKQALVQSDALIAKMKADAQALPGEFEDLLNVFRGTLQGGLTAGAGTDEIEHFSAQMMAVTKTLQIDSDQAGREIAEIFENRAGAHNKVFMRLRAYLGEYGDAQAFNQLAAADKLAQLQQAMTKFEPAIAEFGNTWSAVSSTTMDNIKAIVKTATGPLFDAFKGILSNVNAWMDGHGAAVKRLAADYGRTLAESVRGAWQWIRDVGEVAAAWVAEHSDAISMLAGRVWGFVQGALEGLRGGFEVVGGVVAWVADKALWLANAIGNVGNTVAETLGFTTDGTTSYRALGEAVGYVAVGLVALNTAMRVYTALSTAYTVVGKGLHLVMDGTLWRLARSIVLYGVMNAALIADKVATYAAATAKVVAAIATGQLEMVTWALNAAMWANPIGLIIGAVVLLVGVIITAIAYVKELQLAFLEMARSPAVGVVAQLLAASGNAAAGAALQAAGASPEASDAAIARLRAEIDDQKARGRDGFGGHIAEVFNPGGGDRAQAMDFAAMVPGGAAGAAGGGGGETRRIVENRIMLDGKELHRSVVDVDEETRDMEGRE